MMERKTLLHLKEEILHCGHAPRLLELEINLRYFITLCSSQAADATEEDGEKAKDLKNSVSLAKSYLSVINWKLATIKIELENKKTAILAENREPINQMFEDCFQMYLDEYSGTRALAEENSMLRQQLNEAKTKAGASILGDEKKLRKIQEKSIELYRQISALLPQQPAG